MFFGFVQRRRSLDSTSGHTSTDNSNICSSVVLGFHPLQHFICGILEPYVITLSHSEHTTVAFAWAEASEIFWILHASSVLYLCTIFALISCLASGVRFQNTCRLNSRHSSHVLYLQSITILHLLHLFSVICISQDKPLSHYQISSKQQKCKIIII